MMKSAIDFEVELLCSEICWASITSYNNYTTRNHSQHIIRFYKVNMFSERDQI